MGTRSLPGAVAGECAKQGCESRIIKQVEIRFSAK